MLCETWLYRLCRCEEHARFIKFTRVHRGEYRCSCIVSVCRNEIYTEGNWIVAISWKRWTVSRSATVERRAWLWQAGRQQQQRQGSTSVADPEMLLAECYSSQSPSAFWHFTAYLYARLPLSNGGHAVSPNFKKRAQFFSLTATRMDYSGPFINFQKWPTSWCFHFEKKKYFVTKERKIYECQIHKDE